MRPPAAYTDHCTLKSVMSTIAPWRKTHPQTSSTVQKGEPEAELPQVRARPPAKTETPQLAPTSIV